MRYVRCYGAVYRMTEANFQKLLQKLAEDSPVWLPDLGELWGEPVVGEVTDVGTMTREQAQGLIRANLPSAS